MLLDDELPGLTYLKMLCEQFPDLEVVKAFNSPVSFLKEVSDLEVDFCILDIEMPEMNGIELAKLLRGKHLIFTTAYKDYATEAFDLNVVDYVLKPVQKERLFQAIQKVRERMKAAPVKKNFLQLNTAQGKSLIYFDQILYIKTSEFDSRDKVMLLIDQTELLLKNISFEKLMGMLPADQFCQINKKELLAMTCIRFFSHDEITTHMTDKSGKKIVLKLSETFRNEFIQKITF